MTEQEEIEMGRRFHALAGAAFLVIAEWREQGWMDERSETLPKLAQALERLVPMYDLLKAKHNVP